MALPPRTLEQGRITSPLLGVHRVPQADGAVLLGPRLESQRYDVGQFVW